ncbi:MAG: sugar ABC transporter permease [candidate division Zixibacteria bacterium]|nr:sugar ABC transporter permease [candidate division Zixibacteria bacterium]
MAGNSRSFRRTDLLFLSPWLATLLLFWLFPIIASFAVSLTDYQLLSGNFAYVGSENFRRLFADDVFLRAILNTVVFTVGTLPVTTACAILLALFLNANLPARRFFQSVYFFPSVVSLVVVALIFSSLYARGGYIQMLGELAGLSAPEHGFLFSQMTALPAIMAMDIWMSSGYYMLLFLAALQSIPRELYDAAALEGASWWQRFRIVTLPHLKPMLLFVVILNTIKSFQIFVEVFVMTKGGPLNSTMTIVYFVYEEGLHKFNIGYGAAAANLLFALIALIAWLELKLIRERTV